jgi:hypothetical protein
MSLAAEGALTTEWAGLVEVLLGEVDLLLMGLQLLGWRKD